MAKLLWNCFFTFKKKPLKNYRKHCDSRCNDSTEFFEYVNISAISKHIWKYFSKRVLYSKEIMKKRDQKSPHTVPIKSLKLSVYITDFDEWWFPFNNSCSQQYLFSLDRFVLVKIKLRHSNVRSNNRFLEAFTRESRESSALLYRYFSDLPFSENFYSSFKWTV